MSNESNMDPYFSSKKIIECELDNINIYHDRYIELINKKTKKLNSKELEWVVDEIKKIAGKIKLEINEIEKSFEIVENNPIDFSDILNDIPARKEYVNKVKIKVKDVEVDIKRKEREIRNKEKNQLFKGYDFEEDQKKKLREFAVEENQEFINEHTQQQELLIKRILKELKKS